MGLKEILGEELFEQVQEKLGTKKIDILDNYVPRSRLNEVVEKNKLNEEKLVAYQKQIEETKTMLDGTEELKGKYAKLQEQYNLDLKNKDTQISNILKKSTLKEKLVNEGAKHPELLMKEIDFDKITIEGDKLIGADDIIKGIKETYNDLFITKVKEGKEPTKTEIKDNDDETWDFSNF